MLNNGVIVAILESSDQMNRSVPHMVMLKAFSALFLAILDVSLFWDVLILS